MRSPISGWRLLSSLNRGLRGLCCGRPGYRRSQEDLQVPLPEVQTHPGIRQPGREEVSERRQDHGPDALALAMKPRRSQRLCFRDGFPGYVHGWVCMAKENSMQRGYRDVGYLLAPRIREFRPAHIGVRSWFQKIAALGQHIDSNDKAAVGAWVRQHYPVLMQIVPARRQRAIVVGLMERAREEWCA